MDNSSSDISFSNPCPNDTVCILEATFVIAVVFLTLTSNLMNITVLLTTPALRNSHGYLLLSLSVSDLLIGVVAALSIYPSATLQDSPDSWPYGDIVCAISTYAMQIFNTNSGLTLTLMSVERYIAVAHPLKYSQLVTKTKALVYIAIGWSISVLIIVLGGQSYGYAGIIYVCFPLLNVHPVFVYLYIFALVSVSIIVIVITSVVVRKILKKNARRLSTPRPSSSCQEDRASQGTSRRTIKLFRMVRVMTIAVIVCWLPIMCSIIVYVSFGNVVPQVIFFLSFWMLISNSYINSIIYFVMNKTFHDRVQEICEQLIPTCCRQLNEFEKNCSLCFCGKGVNVELQASVDNASNETRVTPQTSVELVQFKAPGVDNKGFDR